MESYDDEIIDNNIQDEEIKNNIKQSKTKNNKKIKKITQNNNGPSIKSTNTMVNNNNNSNSNQLGKSKQIVSVNIILPQKTQTLKKNKNNQINLDNNNPFQDPKTKPKFKSPNQLYQEIKNNIDKKIHNNVILCNNENNKLQNNNKKFNKNKTENIPLQQNKNNNLNDLNNNFIKKIDKLNINQINIDIKKEKIGNKKKCDSDVLTSKFSYNHNLNRIKKIEIRDKRGVSDRVNNFINNIDNNEIKETSNITKKGEILNNIKTKTINIKLDINKDKAPYKTTKSNNISKEINEISQKKTDVIEIEVNDPKKIMPKPPLRTRTPAERQMNNKLNINMNKREESLDILGNINKIINLSKNKINNDLNKINNKKDFKPEKININLINEKKNKKTSPNAQNKPKTKNKTEQNLDGNINKNNIKINENINNKNKNELKTKKEKEEKNLFLQKDSKEDKISDEIKNKTHKEENAHNDKKKNGYNLKIFWI